MDDCTSKSRWNGAGGLPRIGQVGAARLEGYGTLAVVQKYWQGRMEGGKGNWSLVLLFGKPGPSENQMGKTLTRASGRPTIL